jgi:hypothetical protein
MLSASSADFDPVSGSHERHVRLRSAHSGVKFKLRKEWGLAVLRKSVSIALILCALAACGRNVEPGDAQYPVFNKSPRRILNITLISPPSVKAEFLSDWFAYNSRLYADKCAYSGFGGGVPADVGYSIMVPLSFSGIGTVLHSKFAFDMYEPGLCGYRFLGLFYGGSPASPSQMPLPELITYKDDPSLPDEASVDLWCYPKMGSAKDYDCDSITAASIQNINAAPANRRPWLPTQEQAAAAKANGDNEPPALIGPNTRSLLIRVHDAKIN